MTTRRLAAVEDGAPTLLRYFAMCGVWALSTYTACDIRCSYCITYAQGPSKPRVARAEVGRRLREELRAVPPDGIVGVGSLIDAYPGAEARCGVTREAMRTLAEQERRVLVSTKGTTVARDIDLLRRIPHVGVNVSLCCLDDAVLHRLEPGAPTAAQRLATVHRLAAAGIAVQLQVQPWIPGVTDADVLLDRVDESVDVWFAPLNVDSPAVRRTRLAAGFTQAEVDDAYLRAAERASRRPNVRWQRPLWLSRPGHRPPPSPESSRPEEKRNLAVVRRLLEALEDGTQLQALFGTWSPYVRCVDARGIPALRDPGSGSFRDVLFEAAGAFDQAGFAPVELRAEADRVWARIEVTGRHVRPLLGIPPSGALERFVTEHTFRFDRQGLVVELTQDVDATSLPATRSSDGRHRDEPARAGS